MSRKKATRTKASRSKQRTSSGGKFAPGNAYRFTAGQSGNPGGRPKGMALIRPLLRSNLAALAVCEACEGSGKKGRGACRACAGTGQDAAGETNAQRIARLVVMQAASGNMRCIEWLVDNTEGPATQSLEVGINTEGGPLFSAEALREIMRRKNERDRIAEERGEAVH